MKIFDTHCHYNLSPIKEDWQNAWQKAQENGVSAGLVAGANLENSQIAVEIAQSEENLFAAVGIHPEDAQKLEITAAAAAIAKLATAKKVVAIGEIGLDYFYFPQDADAQELEVIKAAQKELFIAQIKIANKRALPIILHVRDRENAAYSDSLAIVKKYAQNNNSLIFHCISGPKSYIEEILTLPNSYIGFDGNLTFKNAAPLREIFKLVQRKAPEKILLETDAPFLAPVPYRGQSCQPWMISATANFAKTELGADLTTIFNNSSRAFNLTALNL